MPSDTTRTDTAPALTKHGALVRVTGQPSLLQRMAASAMHLHVCEELGSAGTEWHTIAIRELADTIGYASHDGSALHKALLGLPKLHVSFDLTGNDGGRLQGCMNYMSQVIIEHNAGLCRYSYPPTTRSWLRRPELYAHLTQALLRAFSSRYALALYDLCISYKGNNSSDLARHFRRAGDPETPAVTGWKPLKWWRKALGVKPGVYSQFKYLSRSVVKPAMREVNTFSDIVLEMRSGQKHRKVEELLFVIRQNRQPSLLAPEDFLPPRQTHEPPPPIARPPAPLLRPEAAPAARGVPRPATTHAPKHAPGEEELRARMRASGMPGQRQGTFLAREKKDPGRIARPLEHMDTIPAPFPEEPAPPPPQKRPRPDLVAEAAAFLRNYRGKPILAKQAYEIAERDPQLVLDVGREAKVAWLSHRDLWFLLKARAGE